MLRELFEEVTPGSVLMPLVILVVCLVLAWFFHVFLKKAVKRLAQKAKSVPGDTVISALKKPLIAAIVLVGFYFATISLPLRPDLDSYLAKGTAIILSLLGIYAATTLLYALMGWYRRELAAQKETGVAGRLLRFLQLVTWVVGTATAILVVLHILGIALTPVQSWVGEHGLNIALIVVLSVIAILGAVRLIPEVLINTLSQRPSESEEEVKKRIDTLSRVLNNVIQVVVLFIAIFMVLSEFGIDIAPILAGLGVAGIAVGLGAQSLIKDLVAGLFIILENQYRVGDVVKIADVAGLVEDINLRRTMLRDLDGIVHIVPNGEIRVASNFTREWSRVNLNVSVAYGENLDHVIAVINRVGKEFAEDPQWAPLILKAPRALRVDNLGSSGIEIKILGDTKPIYQWDVTGELRKRLKEAFDAEGIEIPWPHTKVYFGDPSPNHKEGQNSPQERQS